MKNSLKSYLFGALSISFLSLITMSCGNINSENSRVTITMPYLSSANTSQNIFSAKSSDFNPSTINDINCFAVMVGAPESVMSRTSCEITKTVTSTVSGSSTTSSTVIGEKRVGIIRGLVPSGNTITLDVPSGSGRIFTLVGLHAATTDACLDFSNSDLNFDVISDPYIVGESAPTNLESGVEVTVPIKLAASGTAFTSDSPKIGECYGPDTPGKNKIIPTKFIITKNSFPSMILKEDSCNPIEIQYVDDLGRRGSLSTNAYGYISYITTNASGSVIGLPLTVYTDKTCSSTPNASGQIIFDKNNDSNSKQLYFNTTGSASATNYNLSISNISGLSNSITGSNQTFPNAYANAVTINVFGANRYIQGECYNLQGSFISVSGSTYTSGSVKYQVDSPLSEAVFYSGKDCGIANVIAKQSVSSTATSPSVSPSLFDFSVRMLNTPYSKGSLKLIPQIASSTTVAFVYPIEVTGGLKNPAQLDLNMWNTFAAGTYCSDVFTVSLANEKGSFVPLSASGTLQISVSSTATVYIKSESCVTLPTTITLSPGEYQKRFTVYPISVSTGAEADILFTANVVHPITGVSTTVKRTQRIKFQ